MKLRFAMDQGECLRRGIDCKSSTVTIEVNPPELPEAERKLIADRMLRGKIDVYSRSTLVSDEPQLICANSPDYNGLIEAVRQDEEEGKKDLGAALKSHLRQVQSSFQPPNA
jgi:hypothetical protein